VHRHLGGGEQFGTQRRGIVWAVAFVFQKDLDVGVRSRLLASGIEGARLPPC
jgi:hypothetical protein